VTIAYQNHDELLKTAAEVLALRERVRSDWFALNVDVGSLRTGDPYEEIARLAPYACTWQIKERLYRRGVEEKTDVRRVFAILRAAGYRGYAPIETLGEGDPREKVRRFLDEVRTALA
jgi:sugar phosphate isomerase/epimerase